MVICFELHPGRITAHKAVDEENDPQNDAEGGVLVGELRVVRAVVAQQQRREQYHAGDACIGQRHADSPDRAERNVCFCRHRGSSFSSIFGINKGFDGSHFITGLSSHLRDLLVSKAPATLPLLEVGASIRERYQAQAQQCPLPFLYRAMKLCNDCDLNYRASKNKRLLVELTLIQVAQLTVEEDDGANGRSPKQAIKPIFTQPAAAQQPQATAAMPQQTVQPAVQTNSTPQPAATQHSNATTPHATPAAVLMAQGREEKKIPVMKMSGLGVSIKRPHIEEEQRNPSSNPTAAHQAAQPEEDYIFNERDLNYYWQEYAGRMPKEQVAIAKRMQNMRITLINDTTFEAVVDNEIVAKEFTGMIPTLQNYLRTRLKNRKVTMTVRISAPTEKVRAYGRVEKFQMMAQKNSALLQLKEEFGLELY